MTEDHKRKLIVTLPSDTEVAMERTFDAPRDLVFNAFADPSVIPQWWGLTSTKTVVEKMEFKPGGAWRYVERDGDGNAYAFFGVYREIVPPEKISYTFEFEGMPGKVAVDSIVFEDLGDKTRMKVTTRFDSKDDRDGMIASGMETGANESYDSLDILLAALQAK